MSIARAPIFLFAFILLTMPVALRAAEWPVFLPPDIHFLLEHHDIDTTNCPQGKGKLQTQININIYSSRCLTYCPPTWNWTSNSDGACLDLATDFVFQRYDIETYRDHHGVAIYSSITAYYGNADSTHSAFTFVFITPKNHWHCIVMNDISHSLTCANDM